MREWVYKEFITPIINTCSFLFLLDTSAVEDEGVGHRRSAAGVPDTGTRERRLDSFDASSRSRNIE